MNGYNFVERVRKMLAGAREEAAALNHEYIGTEHILLGMLGEGDGTGIEILENLGVDLAGLRATILGVVKRGRTGSAMGPDLPFTSRAKKVLEEALAEATELHHSYVGSEHLLLGLLREERAIAAQVLNDAGVTIDNARQEMLRILGTAPSKAQLHTSAWDDATAKATAENPAIPQYADRVRLVVAAAYDVAKRQKASELTMVHTAIALLEHGRGVANTALDRIDFRRNDAVAALTELSTRGTVPTQAVDVLTVNREMGWVLESVDLRNYAAGVTLGTHHLLVDILRRSPDIATVFATHGVTTQIFRDAVNQILG